MARLSYTPEQREAIENEGGALLVSAAAGSGKTRVLVERLMRYITDAEKPHDVDEFLMITYTRAAASELRGRILEELSSRLADSPRDRRLRRQTELCRRAHICTIHSFCTELLRENAHRLDISPDFRVADETEAELIKAKVLEDVLDGSYETISENPDFSALVDTMSAGRDDSRLIELVLDAHAKLQSHPYPERWALMQIERLEQGEQGDAADTVWGALLLKNAVSTARYWRGRMVAALDDIASSPEMDVAYRPSVETTLAGIDRFISAAERGWDSAAAACEIDFPRTKPAKGFEDVKKTRTDCKAALKKLAELFSCSSYELWEDMDAVRPAVSELLRLTLRFDRAYSAEKRKRGIIDFSDQEHLAVALLWDAEAWTPTDAAREASERFTEIMVDEYQDVNAVQELIFGAVSKNGSNLFMVGDVKQSIYRFRLADPTIFLKKYSQFRDYSDVADGEPRKVILPANFRSRPAILDAVNFVFTNIMSTEFGEMDYTERESLRAGRVGGEPDFPAVELNVIDLAEPDGDEEEQTRAEADAAFVAGRIAELMSAGTMIPEGEAMRPLRFGDIAILLHAVKNKAWRYAAALGELGIPATAPGGEGFFETTEIAVMTSLIAVVDNPLQDIPLISVLRSPLYGFTADELSKIRLCAPSETFYNALLKRAEDDEKCRSFLNELEDFRAAAPDVSSDRLLWYIYTKTDAQAIFGAMTGGARRRENLMRLYGQAQQLESGGYKGLFAFSTMLRRLMERGKEPPAPDGAGGGDSVQIMSIHKSKGLEFPVVILADMDARFNLTDVTKPLLFHPELGVGAKRTDTARRISYPTLARMAVAQKMTEESLSEELRVLYVAMTRAREKLIMTATLKNAEKRLSALAADAALPVQPQVLKGMRSFAPLVLLPALMRPECSKLIPDADIVPAEQQYRWDVRLVRAGPARRVHIPDTVAEEEPEAEPDRAVEEMLEWSYPYTAASQLPSKLTATELKGRFSDAEAADEAETAPGLTKRRRDPLRPDFARAETPLTGAERGTALHLAMQYIDFAAADSGSVEAELIRLRDGRFLTEKQYEAADAGKLRRFMESELGRRILAADSVRRELKFSLLCRAEEFFPGAGDDELLFQGVVDLCFEEAGELTVVDFKTDYVTEETLPARAAGYTPQIASYAMAMSRVMGIPVKERILYFFKMDRAVRV